MKKKLAVIVLALVMVVSMAVTAHAAAPDVQGTWTCTSATYTQVGADFMNQYFPVDGFTWEAGIPYPATAGAAYIFSETTFSSTVPAASEAYTWIDDTSFKSGDAVWTVAVNGDSMVLTETAMGTAYACTRVAGTGGSAGGNDGGTGTGSPNTADPFALGMYATMAVASLGGLVALKKKRG